MVKKKKNREKLARMEETETRSNSNDDQRDRNERKISERGILPDPCNFL